MVEGEQQVQEAALSWPDAVSRGEGSSWGVVGPQLGQDAASQALVLEL